MIRVTISYYLLSLLVKLEKRTQKPHPLLRGCQSLRPLSLSEPAVEIGRFRITSYLNLILDFIWNLAAMCRVLDLPALLNVALPLVSAFNFPYRQRMVSVRYGVKII